MNKSKLRVFIICICFSSMASALDKAYFCTALDGKSHISVIPKTQNRAGDTLVSIYKNGIVTHQIGQSLNVGDYYYKKLTINFTFVEGTFTISENQLGCKVGGRAPCKGPITIINGKLELNEEISFYNCHKKSLQYFK